jgi:hypothetical protein
MRTRIMAIDPGASGGIACIYPSGDVTAIAMPDDGDLRDEIAAFVEQAHAENETPVAYMELVGGFIAGNRLPGSAMFNFGSGYGYMRGLLAMARIETRLVRPQEWQTGIPGVRGQREKAIRKRALKEHAARLFPHLKVTLKTADALCIADFARRAEALKGAVAA